MLRIPIEAAPALSTPAWVDVDLDAVAHNVRAFRRLLPAGCRLIAVVKANAYGHGIVACARTALQHGASELAVANVHEGAQLRDAGVIAPILIAGPTAPAEAGLVVQHGLTATVATVELAHALAAATRRYLPVHVEVDTGMGRHGVAPHALNAFVERLVQRGKLAVAGVYTHFAATTVEQSAAMQAQLAAFHAAVDGCRALRGTRRHVSNTLGTLAVPQARLEAVRVGGGLYGFDPFHGARVRGPLDLRPALALKARLVGLRDLPTGAPVGYGSAFTCARPSRVGLVPLGYADGLPRARWADAPVLVRGVRAPIVGAVSMNQTVVDVTDVPGAALGDEVVWLGAQGGERIVAEERVEPGGSAYEVTTLLRASLPRRYLAAAGANEACEGRSGRGAAMGDGAAAAGG